MRLVIVTDLDGTLLDPVTYEFGPALEALHRVERTGIPLVVCSSKTRAEIEAIQRRLGIAHPFISENGGAIVAPPGYFVARAPASVDGGGRFVLELGRPYREIVAILREVAAAEHVRVIGFSDMTVSGVALDCGLSVFDAQLAKLRQYDEPFRFVDSDPAARSRFLRALRRRGVKLISGGRYEHATGDSDKGRAVTALRDLYAEWEGTVTLAGLGDGLNDVSMLRVVDIPFIVRSDMHGATGRLLRKVPTARVTQASGPAGWAEAVTAVLDGARPAGFRLRAASWLGRG